MSSDGAESVQAPSGDVGELSDAELGRVLTLGVVCGAPFVYVLTVVLGLLAGIGVNAVWVAVVPALFAGTFFGPFCFLNLDIARRERAHREAPRSGRDAAP